MYCHPHPVLLDFHTPEPRKIYLTQLTIELSSALLPCHRTVGDRANRGLQHGNGRKKQQMFKRAIQKGLKHCVLVASFFRCAGIHKVETNA